MMDRSFLDGMWMSCLWCALEVFILVFVDLLFLDLRMSAALAVTISIVALDVSISSRWIFRF